MMFASTRIVMLHSVSKDLLNLNCEFIRADIMMNKVRETAMRKIYDS